MTKPAGFWKRLLMLGDRYITELLFDDPQAILTLFSSIGDVNVELATVD